ncbi:MAG TPA: EAL domain-containing protein [Rhodocyclaceae bacterium]|nr:EAL domain-containing protein [Rhodocyclaceae bacterium]
MNNQALQALLVAKSWFSADQQLDIGRVLGTLINNLDGMAFRCRIDEFWTMLFVSGGCHKLTGHPPESLVMNRRLSYEQLTYPDDRDKVRRQILAAVQGRERYRIEYRISHADGAVRWVAERGIAILDETGELVLEGFIEDITEQMLSSQALAEAESRYRSIFENSSEGIFQTSADGRYLNANPTLARIYGYPSAQAMIVALQDIGNQLYLDASRRRDFKRIMVEHGSVQGFEAQIRRQDGEVIWISENARTVCSADGAFLYYEGTVQDITERKRYQEQLEHQANHDLLTGLPNRSLLNDRLQQAIGAAVRYGYFAVVAFIDLDNFKFINDSLGHQAGDQLLVEIAMRLSLCLRSTDTVARYGGDEFVLVINNYYQIGQVVQVLERVIQEIARPVAVGEQDLFVSCSIGVSHYPSDGEDPQTLIMNADAAMYLAKERGKSNFQFYTKNLNGLATERVRLEGNLRCALERGEMQVHYQPKVDRSGRIVGVEALARWNSAELGWMPPDKFIPIAEETGLIESITEFVLRSACLQAAAWHRRGSAKLRLAVNLSARLLRQPGLPGLIAAVLKEAGMPAALLELEITESAVIGDVEECIVMLRALKDIGVLLVIDDFGTGYSSLSYLQRFPIDILKIDKSFVSNGDVGGSPIAAAIISLGHSMRLRVVAEGVETEAQWRFLDGLGCDEFQGYLFSKPVAAPELGRMLADYTGSK